MRKNETVWGDRVNEKVVWHVVNRYCRSIGLEHVAPHDLRTQIGGQPFRAQSMPTAPGGWRRFPSDPQSQTKGSVFEDD